VRTDLKSLKFEVKASETDLLGIDLKSVSLKRKINNDESSTKVSFWFPYLHFQFPCVIMSGFKRQFRLENLELFKEQLQINEIKKLIRIRKKKNPSQKVKSRNRIEQFTKRH
jgi:hypothetical protein